MRRADKDDIDIIRRLGLEKLEIRYIKTTNKAHPLRAREIATDSLSANPSDVIVHLDGDDWLPYPDVLSRLNRIYRNGVTRATYGNALCLRSHDSRNFQEYSQYDMSQRWNVSQKNLDSEIFPFREVDATEISNGWSNAPWCGMHLRSFQLSKWLGLNRSTFRDANGSYLRVATDAAILIPILDSCDYNSVTFVPDVAYVYQNANNTIHAKKEVLPKEKAEALKAIANANLDNDHIAVRYALSGSSGSTSLHDAIISYDSIQQQISHKEHLPPKAHKLNKARIIDSAIITIVTPDYLADAIICLMSYQRNLRERCDSYIFVATINPAEISACQAILKDSGFHAIFPSSLKHTKNKSEALLKKYKINSDEYRWAMKSVVLLELLRNGKTMALFLDPDTYTVSDITSMHARLCLSPISVFPHFRDPDQEYLRGVLYKDGFFNGGMLAATPSGIPHLTRLFVRCLQELTKDPARHRWDDQKYFDLFTLEVEDLYVNLDRGINYNPWNYEPVEGLVAPSQRSTLLKSGFFVRHWHMSTMLINNSVKSSESKFLVYRPTVAIYLTSIIYTIALILLKPTSSDTHSVVLPGLLSRYKKIEDNLKKLSPEIPLNNFTDMIGLIEKKPVSLEVKLDEWGAAIKESICFDNLELFSRLLQALLPNCKKAAEIQQLLRKHDLRYMTDEIIEPLGSKTSGAPEPRASESAGKLIQAQLRKLQESKINY